MGALGWGVPEGVEHSAYEQMGRGATLGNVKELSQNLLNLVPVGMCGIAPLPEEF